MKKIIKYMLEEDEGFEDVTSNALIDSDKIAIGEIISKDNGILAGIDIIRDIFNSKNIAIIDSLKEGSEIYEGDVILKVKGNALDILLLERTVLNLLMRMSGVATAANDLVNLVKDHNVIIAGTRKTSPAISKFDKYALWGILDINRFI